METKADQSGSGNATPPLKDRSSEDRQAQSVGPTQIVQPLIMDTAGGQIPVLVQVSPSVNGVPVVNANVIHSNVDAPPGVAEQPKVNMVRTQAATPPAQLRILVQCYWLSAPAGEAIIVE